jgi:hypothetical protein
MRTAHDVKTGIVRLLSAPRDIKLKSTHEDLEISLGSAPINYRHLFHQYAEDFVDVYELVSEVWESDLDELVDNGSSVAEAIQTKLDGCAAGPAQHPNFVWLVRKYWLECARTGETAIGLQRVRPEVFLLKWMMEQGRDDYVQLLTAMPYWPIGLDENGNWC